MINSLVSLSCSGNRVWDAGESDTLAGATSYATETANVLEITNSAFPCTAFWDYDPVTGCSDLYTYEGYRDTLALSGKDFDISQVGTFGADFFLVTTDGILAEASEPANISFTQLVTAPDCT